MLRSTLTVIGCYLLSIALVLGSDPLLSRLFPGDFIRGRIPSNPALLASTACFVVVSIFCAWLCARLARGRVARHVFWFFVLGEVMGVAASAANWSNGWPHWYPLAWLLTWPVSCWIGLRLAGRRAPDAARARNPNLAGVA